LRSFGTLKFVVGSFKVWYNPLSHPLWCWCRRVWL